MKRTGLTLLVLLLIIAGAITAGYFILSEKPPLPVFAPSDVNPELVPEDMQNKTRNHRIGDFSLTDQDGKDFTREDIRGKIVLADFFFVTCPSICPKMTTEMKRVHDAFANDPEVILLSHTVMPETDSVPVLKHYSDSIGVTSERWRFLTGDKEEIYALARRSYMATKSEGDGGEHDFIHTENLILVDGEGKIRGYYDGTSPVQADKAIDDITRLLKEQREKPQE